MVNSNELRDRAKFMWRIAAENPDDGFSKSHDYTAMLLVEAAKEIERLNGVEQDDDTITMTPKELATYVEGYLRDLAVDAPDEAGKIFMHVFPSATVLIENGTFIVDMDGKTG